MNDLEMIDLALKVASKAHRTQRDKAGAPYVLHPMRVASVFHPSQTEEIVVALLHDVTEDSDPSLIEPFPDAIRAAVDALTRRPGESYEDFIERVSLDPLATRVKLADLRDNMRADRMYRHDGEYLDRMRRYLHALERLNGVHSVDGPLFVG